MSVGSDGGIGEALDPPANAGAPEATSLEGGGPLGSSELLAASRDTGNILAQTLGVGSGQSFMIDVEHAPQAIADLEAAAEALEQRAQVARNLLAKLRADLQTYLQVDKLDLPSEASGGLP